MSNIIEEFYYGNIEPQEVNSELTPKLKKKLSNLAEKEEQLTAKLTGEDKKLFQLILLEDVEKAYAKMRPKIEKPLLVRKIGFVA